MENKEGNRGDKFIQGIIDKASENDKQVVEEVSNEVKTEEIKPTNDEVEVIPNENVEEDLFQKENKEDDWDSSEEPNPEESETEENFLQIESDDNEIINDRVEPSVDYEKLSEKLGLENVKTEEDFIANYKELQEKAESNYSFANEEIEVLNEYAKKGKDYRKILQGENTINQLNKRIEDAEKAIPIVENEWSDEEVVKHHIQDKYGLLGVKLTEEQQQAIDSEFYSMDKSSVSLLAQKQRRDFVNQINENIEKFKSDVAEVEQANESIKTKRGESYEKFKSSITEKLNKFDDYEGFKIDDKDKSKVKTILTDELVSVHLPKKFADLILKPTDGKASEEALIETTIERLSYKSMIKHFQNKGKNGARKEEFEQLNNITETSNPNSMKGYKPSKLDESAIDIVRQAKI